MNSLYLRHISFFAIIAIVGVILVSCETELDNLEQFRTDPKLVVHAFLSPYDSIYYIQVNRSRPTVGLIQDEGAQVTNATVELSSNTSKAIAKQFAPGLYTIEAKDLPLETGGTYSIVVSTPDGARVSAKSSVPDAKSLSFSVNLKHSVFKMPNDPSYLNPGGIIHQYFIQYSLSGIIEGETYYLSIPYSTSYIRLKDNSQNYYPYNQTKYLEIKNYGNEPYSLYHGAFSTLEEEKVDSINMSLKLFLTDPHYVRYHQSLDNYTYPEVFTEPSLIYSNVEGGLGVFSLYTVLVHEYAGKVDDILIEP